MKRIFNILILPVVLLLIAACENADWSFPDYDYNTVYFAYQYPVRTLILGNDDTFDNSLDNEHKCKIYATLGGLYSNDKNRTVDITVMNSLCDGVYFADDNSAVTPMPSNYYTLSTSTITIPKGSLMGAVDVQFTDAFFQDTLSLVNHYVIPLVLSNAQNIDSILVGDPVEGTVNPNRCRTSDWEVVPKDYTLYAIKYVNEWDGMYLRRGTDVVTQNGTTTTVSRRNEYVEYDEVFELGTLSLTQADCTVSNDVDNTTYAAHLILTFDSSYNCTVTTDSENCSVSGTGKFVEKGEKKSWGEQDRDAIYLDYTVDFGSISYATRDTLVARDRQVTPEWFTITMDED